MEPADEPGHRPTDEELLAFERAVKAPFCTPDIPRIGELAGWTGLEAEYASGLPIYAQKLAHLASTYRGMRACWRDGNCFYRAFAFRLSELLLHHRGPAGDAAFAQAVLARARETREWVVEGGYDSSIIEDFWEPWEQVLGSAPDHAALLATFNTEHLSDTIVCYLRILTGATLKRVRGGGALACPM